jgi:hypothetical protein
MLPLYELNIDPKTSNLVLRQCSALIENRPELARNRAAATSHT